MHILRILSDINDLVHTSAQASQVGPDLRLGKTDFQTPFSFINTINLFISFQLGRSNAFRHHYGLIFQHGIESCQTCHYGLYL